MKGCVNNREEDASMKVRELNVPLYWANKEKVKGEKKKEDGGKRDMKNIKSHIKSRMCRVTPKGRIFYFFFEMTFWKTLWEK